jgi:fucose permease
MALFQEVTSVSVTGAFVFGMLLVMLSSARPALAKRLVLAEGSADWLIGTFNLALIPMMILSGLAVDYFGAQVSAIAGSVVSALALFTLATADTYLRAQGAILLLGAGGAFLSTASSVLMVKAFFPENEAASQNMGNVFFGVGALLAPVLTHTLLNRLGYRRGLMFVAIIVLAPALAAALTAPQAFRFETESGSLASVFAAPVFWAAAAVFLLYGPLEGSLGLWTTRYFNAMGFREKTAQWLLTGFWLAFLSARLAAALLQKDHVPRFSLHGWSIIILALGAAVAVGNMAGARTRSSAAGGLLLVGAFLGPIFPTLVAVLFQNFTGERGTAYGAMFSVGATGSLLLPPMIGVYARRSSPQRAMRIPMILALVLALAAFVLAVIQPAR